LRNHQTAITPIPFYIPISDAQDSNFSPSFSTCYFPPLPLFFFLFCFDFKIILAGRRWHTPVILAT
jgi:hypothetical protein